MKKLFFSAAALLTAAAFAFCVAFCPMQKDAVAEPLQKFSDVFTDTFDTVISVIGFAPDAETFAAHAASIHEVYVQLHMLFDNYNAYEGVVNIYALNQLAAKEPVQVDPILYGMLKFAKSHYELCQGQMNVAMGSVLSIWHTYREAGLDDPEHAQLPPHDDLVAASAHTSIDDLILDDENRTVFYADPELKLDVGAIAKGYATEIVAQMLMAGDMPHFIISAGGNVRIGLPPCDGRAAWGVGIQDPDGAVFGTNDIVDTLFLSGMSVVTSGDYQRFYVVDGKPYHHLIDPDTLYPDNDFRAVTIVTRDSGYADMLSTSAFLMPLEQSRAFIESLDDVEALWLLPDGTELMTDGLRAFAKSQGATNPAK